ncbi:MAG: hypothetical protein ACJ71R_02010 [Nitrososphaeraceae archaeon]
MGTAAKPEWKALKTSFFPNIIKNDIHMKERNMTTLTALVRT